MLRRTSTSISEYSLVTIICYAILRCRYDIVLDVLIVNQTSDTLEAVSLELATLGDLKLVEKPSPVTLAPHDFTNIRANAKVG